jgi:hypothetical protein
VISSSVLELVDGGLEFLDLELGLRELAVLLLELLLEVVVVLLQLEDLHLRSADLLLEVRVLAQQALDLVVLLLELVLQLLDPPLQPLLIRLGVLCTPLSSASPSHKDIFVTFYFAEREREKVGEGIYLELVLDSLELIEGAVELLEVGVALGHLVALLLLEGGELLLQSFLVALEILYRPIRFAPDISRKKTKKKSLPRYAS